MICAFEELWECFAQDLFQLPGKDADKPLFNPYSGVLPGIDRPSSDQLRRQNLRNYFSSFSEKPCYLVLGEAPGWRGCRFTGVPFTSEALLESGKLPFSGKSTSLTGGLYSEASATVFWATMRLYHPRFLVWNCLPLHPYQAGQPLTNRPAASKEILLLKNILLSMIDILKPEKLVAVGRTAQRILAHLGFECDPVRHPAHGGTFKFKSEVQAFFSKMGIIPS
jgi:uracil-DNA glycosylase